MDHRSHRQCLKWICLFPLHQARRGADLAALVADIQSPGRGVPPVQSTRQDQPLSGASPSTRIGWLRLEVPILGIAFALTLLAGMYAYLTNSQLDVPQLFFLFVVFYALVLAARCLRARVRRGRKNWEHCYER